MSKISLGQLDLTALQQYFEIVAGFRKKGDKADDVEYVGEYKHLTIDNRDGIAETNYSKVEANQVAMAALDESGLPIAFKKEDILKEGQTEYDNEKLKEALERIKDDNGDLYIPERQTVVNSLMLGGVPASEYLQTVRADTILTDVNQATYNMADDIRNLKDELYQLKNQLVKTGTIKDSNVYNGFIDSFIANNNKHMVSTGIVVTGYDPLAHTIDVQSTEGLQKGDYIVLEDDDGNFNIQVIDTILGLKKIQVDSSKEMGPLASVTSSDTTSPDPRSIIKKSLGISESGKFVFGHQTKDGTRDGIETSFIVKDGTSRIKVFELDHRGHGFGTEIKIPASLENNTISAVEFSLAVKGNPGSVRGVFWKYDEAAATYTKTDYRTDTVSSLEASGWFNNFKRNLITEMPVKPGEKYLLILETEMGSVNDKWYIGGFAEEDCLDDVHNDCYIQSNGLLYKSAEDTDMFLVLNAIKKEEAKINKLPYGLYTCKFDIYQSLATRIRVEMCISKEGMFKVKDNNSRNLARGMMSGIPIEPKGRNIIRYKMFDQGDDLIIGTELGTVASCGTNSSSITPREDIYIAHNADVYRVGYQIRVVASNKEFDPTVTGVIERNKNVSIYDLKLVDVIPGRDIIRPEQSSDRLIFECDFSQDDSIKLKQFNHIELQILWKAPNDITSDILNTYDELEGAILDLTVSVDQAYTKEPTGGAE